MISPEQPARKNIRLSEYDYSTTGAYFITICTQDRRKLFSDIVGADLVSARVRLNQAGHIIDRVYNETIASFINIKSNCYVIMPNHFHCIISIRAIATRANTRFAPTSETTAVEIGDIIKAFKSKTTVEYIRGVKAGLLAPFNKRLWQRNYYEHVIRNQDDLLRIWQYIEENPSTWSKDRYYTS